MLDATRNTQHALTALLLALALTACSPPRPPADLRIVNGAEPGSLDPATATGLEELRVVMALFEGLMRVDPKTAQPVPGLAERYEISPDLKTYTFHLRTNAVWSTGERITAHDFVYSWFRVLDPATASGGSTNSLRIASKSASARPTISRSKSNSKTPPPSSSTCARSRRSPSCR